MPFHKLPHTPKGILDLLVYGSTWTFSPYESSDKADVVCHDIFWLEFIGGWWLGHICFTLIFLSGDENFLSLGDVGPK